MATLEIKKSPDGRIMARRTDRKPLTPKDMQEARKLAESQATDSPPCWNCGEATAATQDIYGREVFICDRCAVSADDPPKDDPNWLRAWVADQVRGDDGRARAVKICSALLDDYLWLILDRAFIPHDGLACYYAEEIPLLRGKTPEELKGIHKTKLAFPGCRVIQEGAEAVETR